MAHGLIARSARVTARLAASSRSVAACSSAASCARTPTFASIALSSSSKTVTAGFPRCLVRVPLSATPTSSRCLRTCALPSMKEVSFEPESLPAVALGDPATLLQPQSAADAAAAGSAAAAAGGWRGELLVLGVTEEDVGSEGEVTVLKSQPLQQLDSSRLGGVLGELLAAGGFEGKQGTQSRVVRLPSGGAHVALVGLGKAAKLAGVPEWGPSPFQVLGTAVASLAKTQRAVRVAVVPLAGQQQQQQQLSGEAVAAVTAGVLLGGYESGRFKSKKSPTASKLAEVQILAAVPDTAAAEAAVARGVAVARGNILTRYLVEAPPNVCTPTHLAAAAAHVAARAPECFHLKVYERGECEEMGMGCFLGVAEASAEPPKLIHLKYSPKGGSPSRKVAIVGKGLTFDSGGYNLKAGAGSMIELMKFDMGGAGAVLGAASILAELQPADVELHFIIAACENMVAGAGLRPGDILTAASGKTVEVNNTDAEGRLTLADAMWFAQEKCGATTLLDIATLTGACMVALGPSVAGLLTPSEGLAEQIRQAARAAGERVWRLPLEEEYFEGLKSPVADLRNTAGRLGGTITAALFLKQFVKEGVEWAHLDVAGPVWSEKQGLPTGFGAALLAEWALAQAREAGAAAPVVNGK